MIGHPPYQDRPNCSGPFRELARPGQSGDGRRVIHSRAGLSTTLSTERGQLFTAVRVRPWRNQLCQSKVRGKRIPQIEKAERGDCHMTWFLVDDGLSQHPKVTSAKRGASRERMVGLWTLAGSWSSKYLTEGHIPHEQIDELGCTQQSAQALVQARLWHIAGHDCDICPQPPGNDYQFHDWTQANQTRFEVLDKRAKKSAAGSKGGKASGETRRNRSKNEASAEASASRMLEAKSNPYPIPSYPNPSLVTLVCRRLFGDATKPTTDDERSDLWSVWAETAGQGVDLETELSAWLIHNGNTDLRNPGAALLGWLRTAAKRAAEPRSPGCEQCLGGWISDEFGQPSEHRCTNCRPHLRAVEAS